MGKNSKNLKETISKKGDQKLLIGIGITTLALIGVGYWYYKKRKEKETELILPLDDMINTAIDKPKRVVRFTCSSKEYPLAYGTCHRDVNILQSYLSKMYKEDLGRSGKNKDGVDGMFGNKTNKAAKKHLGKASFSKQDIDGMRTAIKMIKR